MTVMETTQWNKTLPSWPKGERGRQQRHIVPSERMPQLSKDLHRQALPPDCSPTSQQCYSGDLSSNTWAFGEHLASKMQPRLSSVNNCQFQECLSWMGQLITQWRCTLRTPRDLLLQMLVCRMYLVLYHSLKTSADIVSSSGQMLGILWVAEHLWVGKKGRSNSQVLMRQCSLSSQCWARVFVTRYGSLGILCNFKSSLYSYRTKAYLFVYMIVLVRVLLL